MEIRFEEYHELQQMVIKLTAERDDWENKYRELLAHLEIILSGLTENKEKNQ